MTRTLIKARWLGALGVLASLTAVAGAAWACGPSYGPLAISPTQGQAGSQMTVAGSGFHEPPVRIHWNSTNGPLLATASEHAFSVKVTVPASAPGVHYVMARGANPDAPYSTAAFTVTDPPTLSINPGSGRSGSRASVTGNLFPSGATVRLHWDSMQGPLVATATGPSFTTPVTVPGGAAGEHRIVAVSDDLWKGLSPAAGAGFRIAAPPVRTVTVSDEVGPSIASAALRIANRGRRVSPKGYVTLFCGSFDEAGVVGRCGARSVRRPALRLRDRLFEARRGRAVRLRFRLSPKAVAALRKAGKVRMRGHVAARDHVENRSSATFRFTLGAPRAGGGSARSSGTLNW